MKRLIVFIVVFCSASATMFAQLRSVGNEAFQRGEKLTYNVYYDAVLTGKVKAGTATLEVKDENKIINGRNTYHVVAYGKTKGAFNLFFKVIDRYESYLDEESIAPWLFIRRVNEGGYIINQDITFNQSKQTAYFMDNKKGRSSTVVTPAYVQDIISIFYYARTYEFSTASANSDFPVKFMIDDTVYSTKFIYLGKEKVKTALGTIRCLKFKPQVLTGSVFKDPYPMIVYVSDDKNRVPVLAESEVLVGTVKLELISYSGLKSGFTAMLN
jgi:hypothetical protein